MDGTMMGMFDSVMHAPNNQYGFQTSYEGFGGFKSWLKKRVGRGPSIRGLKSSIKGTAHTVGTVAESKITKGILAAGLAATGVGAGAGALIMGAEGVTGGALSKHGGLKRAIRGGAEGAAIGAASGFVGKTSLIKKIPGVTGLRRLVGTRTAGGTEQLAEDARAAAAQMNRMAAVTGAANVEKVAGSAGAATLLKRATRRRPIAPGLPRFPGDAGVQEIGTPISYDATQRIQSSEILNTDVVKRSRESAQRKAKADAAQTKKLRKHGANVAESVDKTKSTIDKYRDEALQAIKNAQDMAASVQTPPGGIAPQGGFPAMPATITDSGTTPQPAAQSAGFGSPMILLAIGGAALVMLSSRRK